MIAMKQPKNWPEDIIFLERPMYAHSIPPALLQSEQSPPRLLVVKSPSTVNVQIQLISDESHPAYGQHGLFASRTLVPDTFICFYLGFVHGPEETDPASNYDLSLDRDHQISVDATKMGNEARFINDYRNIRPEGPNTEFRDCLSDISGVLERRIGVFVLNAGKKGGKRARGIVKGEEIVVSYGKGFWAHRTNENLI